MQKDCRNDPCLHPTHFSPTKTPITMPISELPIAVATRYGRAQHPKTATTADYVGSNQPERAIIRKPGEKSRLGACTALEPVAREWGSGPDFRGFEGRAQRRVQRSEGWSRSYLTRISRKSGPLSPLSHDCRARIAPAILSHFLRPWRSDAGGRATQGAVAE